MRLDAVADVSRRRRPRFFVPIGIIAALWYLVASHPGSAQPTGEFVPAEEVPEDYPAGPGREETFYLCTACHGFKLVAQQGQSRRQWDETLDFMHEKHGMAVLEGDDRKLVLDYLEQKFPPRQAPSARGWQNPFLQR